MKISRSDNGTEFENANLREYFSNLGIQISRSAPYTPEQNGKSERANRTIVESARTMLHAKNLPKFLWAEAINTAVYLQNRVVSRTSSTEKTPFEIWHGVKPSVQHLRIFGATAYAHVPKQFRHKLDAKSRKMILVGYDGDSTNYRLYDPAMRSVNVSRDVSFIEDDVDVPKPTEDFDEMSLPSSTVASEMQNQDDAVAEIADQELFQDAEDGPPEEEGTVNSRVLRDRSRIEKPARYQVNLVESPPLTFQDAMDGPDSAEWKSGREQSRKSWRRIPKMERGN